MPSNESEDFNAMKAVRALATSSLGSEAPIAIARGWERYAHWFVECREWTQGLVGLSGEAGLASKPDLSMWPCKLFLEEEQSSLTLALRIDDIARTYADQLRQSYPAVEVRYRRSATDLERLEIAVVGDKWDPEMEARAHELMWTPEAENSGVVLRIRVFFRERGLPPLPGYSPVG